MKSFDVFVTVDQNLQSQQNLAALPLPVAVLAAPDNRFETSPATRRHCSASWNSR